MEDFKVFIEKELGKYGIHPQIEQELDTLKKSNKINEFMTPQSVYTTLLLRLGKSNPMYKAILGGTKCLFDIELKFNELRNPKKIENSLLKLGNVSYIYIENKFIGIRLLNNKERNMSISWSGLYKTICETILTAEDITKKNIPSFFEFSEIFFEHRVRSDEYSKCISVLERIRGMALPFTLTDDEIIGPVERGTLAFYQPHRCELLANFGDSKEELTKYTKVFFLCQIGKQLSEKSFIEDEGLVIRYKNSYLYLRIGDEETNLARYEFYSMVKRLSSTTKEGIIFAKTLLASHGYSPIYFTDEFIEYIGLLIGENANSGRFLREFLKFNFKNLRRKAVIEDGILKLEEGNLKKEFICIIHQNMEYRIPMPPEIILNRFVLLATKILETKFALFDSEWMLQSEKLLIPSIQDYDFVLSSANRAGFTRVERRSKNGEGLILGRINPSWLVNELGMFAYFFYSPYLGLLMVKMKDGFALYSELLRNILLLKTPFEYFKEMSR
ncbi:hypothetical protein TCON_0303 [Astathelohania contejeani]|uniref:Uncharacterized protein n=1 Tax=Astathelohania contejeani TaxID=164912 RepID=A0ABQ7I1Z9_9MICR|nr:hypothetical protein TCON_0303 [Thelohania contejeani]